MIFALRQAGRLTRVLLYEEVTKGGVRVFSSRFDSNCMKEYHENIQTRGMIVGVDIYCDGTPLSKSGTQSANNMGVRFSNIKGQSEIWHEVGIAPTLDDRAFHLSDPERKRERALLFQRFLFLVLKVLMSASHVVFVMLTVADQPQERKFFSLKGCDSYVDCSRCLLPSILKDLDAVEDNMDTTDRGSIALELKRRARLLEQVLETQTCERPGETRNVLKTVKCQLRVATSRFNRIMEMSQTEFNEDRLLNRVAKRFLEKSSVLELPPASFSGLGTKPYMAWCSAQQMKHRSSVRRYLQSFCGWRGIQWDVQG